MDRFHGPLCTKDVRVEAQDLNSHTTRQKSTLKIDKVNTEQCKLLFTNMQVTIKRNWSDRKRAPEVGGRAGTGDC